MKNYNTANIFIQLVDYFFKSNTVTEKYYTKTVKESESRHPNQIRVFYNNPDEDSIERANCDICEMYPFLKIEESTFNGSLKYSTFKISIKENLSTDIKIPNNLVVSKEDIIANLGKSMFLVYAKPIPKDNRTIYSTYKMLSPVNLGISSSTRYSRDDLYRLCYDYIDSRIRMNDERYIALERTLKTLLDYSNDVSQANKNVFHQQTLEPKDVSLTDWNNIKKDFGEILCAISILSSLYELGIDAVAEFPSINASLVDFKIYRNEVLLGEYSVKSDGHQGTGIKGFEKFIAFYESMNSEFPDSYEEFKALVTPIALRESRKTTSERIIEGCINAKNDTIDAFLLDVMEAFSFVKGGETIYLLGKTLNELSLQKMKEGFEIARRENVIPLIAERMSIVFKNLGNDSKNNTPENIAILIEENKYGILIQPLGSLLCKYLNSREDFKRILSDILNCQSNLWQIDTNIRIKNNKIIYHKPTVSNFQASNFKFNYNGMRNDAGNNRPLGYIKEK